MAIALRFCVKKNGSTVSSIQTDTGNTTVTGDTLFVAITDPNSNVSVSDTINGSASGNTWTRVGTALTTGAVVSNLWRCENANGGTNHRVTVTASSGTMDAAVYFGAISGAATASFDKTAQGNATSSPYTGVSTATLSQANELAVVLAGTDGSATTFSESTGFTVQQQENNSSLYWCSAVSTKITSATTALTPSFTVTGGSGAFVGILIATFKESGGGGGPSIAVIAGATYRRRRIS